MLNKYVLAAVALASMPLSAAASETHYSGALLCSDPRQVYLIDDGEGTFQLLVEASSNRYQIQPFESPLKTGSFPRSGTADLVVVSVDEDAAVLRDITQDCAREATLSRVPGIVEAYKAVEAFAKSADSTGENAAKISEMYFNLAPSGLLPALDKQTLPRAVQQAINDFLNRLREDLHKALVEMPLNTQDDANALMQAVADGYPATLGFSYSIFEDQNLGSGCIDFRTAA